MVNPTARDLIRRMAEELDYYRQLLSDDRREAHALATEARAALAQPEPEGDVGKLVAKLRRLAAQNPLGTADPTMIRAADLLERQAAPVPVAVSERLPGVRDCAPWPGEPDASAWCWVGSDVDGGWSWEQRYAGCLAAFPDDFTHWLPAHALPLPEVTP